MALIKCKECGKEISDKAKSCPKCGCPIIKDRICKECGKKIDKNDKICKNCGVSTLRQFDKKILICSVIVVGIILIIILFFSIGSKDTLTCTLEANSTAGSFNYKVTYTFKDKKVKSLKGYQYAKPSDSDVAEYLWQVSNNQQDQYNYYEGLSYKATFSENKEIVLNYEIDVEKAPTMFNTVSTLSGVSGVTNQSTKDEIRNIYEEENFSCK